MTSVAKLRIEADSTGVRKAQGDLSSLGRQSGNTEKSISSLARSFLKFAGIGLGLGAIKNQMSAITNEAGEFERQMLRTEAVIKATGATAGFSADQLREQARQMAFATLESTEGIMQAQQVLLTFRSVSGDTFTRATELAADLATVTGGNLTSSMQQLGRALEDPVQGITALRRSGVSFTQDQRDMIQSLAETGDLLGAQTLILDELAQQYGGVARAEAMSLAGAQDTLGQSVQELRLALDDYLGTSDRLIAFYDRASSLTQEFTAILASGQIQYYLQAIGNEFEYLARDVRQAMEFVSQLVEDAALFWGQSGTDGVGFIIDAFKNIVPNLKTAVQLATVELIVLADRAMVYGKAIAKSLDPRNWVGSDFSFADYVEDENKRIDAARYKSIEAIDQERDAAIKATAERRRVILENGRTVREEWEREQRELTQLAYVANDAISVIDDGMTSAGESTRDFTDDITSLTRALGTDLENAAAIYWQRIELIADAEREGALATEQANEMRARSYEAYQDKVTELAERGAEARRRIEEQEERQRLQRQEQEVRAMQGFFGNLAEVARMGGKDSFEAYKALATVEAGIAGALAFTKALASAPPPFNFALAGSVAALTAVQMATIQNQKYDGARRFGGAVEGGKSYMVGEDGPEIIRLGAGASGHVTPNHKLGGNGEINNTTVFQLSTGVAETAQAEIMRMAPQIVAMCEQAVMGAITQGGAMSRAVGKRS